MRNEEEMFSLILGVAAHDERIRAVILNGSRANPDAPRDALRDYDIVYAVKSVAPFIADKTWPDVFGERALTQEPDDAALFGDASDNAVQYAYLMQFSDGNRIDLTVREERAAERAAKSDGLTVVLLDKDGRYKGLPAPSAAAYRVRRPTAAEFAACCNEFYWVSAYVAKGLWRRELLYAAAHLNDCVRPMLLKMLGWQAGAAHGFTVGVGKCSKYLPLLLPSEDADALYKTYPPAEEGAMWDALYAAVDLFDKSAAKVAAEMNFHFDERDSAGARGYFDFVRGLKR